MKKFQKILLAVVLLFGCFPAVGNAMTQSELTAFLNENNWTEEDLDSYLEYFYDLSLKDFSSIDELKETLGEPITEENLQKLIEDYEFENEEDLVAFLIENGEMEEGDNISDAFRYMNALDSTISFYTEEGGNPITDENLNELLEDYDMTLQELKDLLKKNDDSLDNYETIEDLDMAVALYIGGNEIEDIVSEIGITESEIMAMMSHFESLNLDEATVQEKMTSIEKRLEPFIYLEDTSELTTGQAAELVSIAEEIFNIVELEPKFYLVKGGKKKPVTMNELVKMKDAQGYGLLIELYNKKGELLADALFPADMLNSELIDETVNDMKKVEKTVKKIETAVKRTKDKQPHTIKGGKLPNTAGHYMEWVLVGAFLILAGIIFNRKRKEQA
ncbi:processed acidic surface protein [Bacillus sp. UNC41MFS5]|uniref:processed acidic surface protein n=1 Tax=Bacillus sp. UNC41MFS5 TaxID=1449046 RepID=UPI00047E6036|nr:processed acidic surface protein [Bacillus sp. UNC41MFS5]